MKTGQTVRICVPVCAENLAALVQVSNQAGTLGDIVELRLDCLNTEELAGFSALRDELIGRLSRQVILTLRTGDQGGRRLISDEERLAFWSDQFQSTHDEWFDLEYDLVRKYLGDAAIDWSRVICSHHDFNGVPANIGEIYERMESTPARVIKIAVFANDVVDCLPIFRLLRQSRREDRQLIAIAMGNAGIATRVLGPSRGAFLTYGACESEGATAPGQLLAHDLRSLYRLDTISEETTITGLVGLPVTHSVSPHMHNAAFASERLDGVYLPFEVRDLAPFFRRMVQPRTRELEWNLRGLSITAPHKSMVMDFLDWIDPQAIEIGAVNTVVVEGERLHGYNTDADGMLLPLTRKLQSLKDCRVAVIGAGGAARATVWGLRKNGAFVSVFARDPNKSRLLAEILDAVSGDLASASFNDYDVVINTTPLGSNGPGVADTPATAEQLRGVGLVYDLVYNPSETQLLREAKQAGCQTLGGLEMLVAQAVMQFKLWTGKSPSSAIMQHAAQCSL
jgi:3-dehydroquinate dehydratase/shikimate dehydrogenase